MIILLVQCFAIQLALTMQIAFPAPRTTRAKGHPGSMQNPLGFA
jgi:hypothetical protein